MRRIFTKPILVFAACFSLSLAVQAQRFEAEDATLSGGAAVEANTTASGGFIVASGEGNLSFSINIAEQGYFDLSIHAASPHGDKQNTISIDGSSANFSLVQNSAYETFKIVSNKKLTTGAHTIEIIKSWGWINIDYIELNSVDPSSRFNLTDTLVTPNPIPEASNLFKFLLNNYGNKIISGVMTLNSFDESNWLLQNTGKEPALLGLDLMHCGRNYTWYNDMEPLNDAATWYNKNGIPAICWHWRDPSRITEEFYTAKTAFDVSKISDPTSAEYQAMLSDIDYISGLLKELQNQNVPVIWRPLHEAAGGWFWWGAKGAAPCKQLYLLMYDRMVNYHGLRNLIWVWTREPGDEEWYPGDEYVDIVGRDIYKQGDHSSHEMEFNNMNTLYGGRKMLTISECGSMPDVDNLIADGAAWSWWMPWYGDFTRSSDHNTLTLWQKMFAHDYVITLDEMPLLRTYGTVTGVNQASENISVVAYPTLVSDKLNIRSSKIIQAITIYNTLGEIVKKEAGSDFEAEISFEGLKPGVYLVKVNASKTVKVIKE